MTREVFIAHVEREQEALRGFLLALCCGNKSDADDLAQDALVKAYLSLTGYRDKGKFRSWLFKIAYNTFLNHKASCRTIESIDEARTFIGGTDDPMTAVCFGLAALGVGIAFLVNYGVGKKMLAKEIEAEEERVTTQE